MKLGVFQETVTLVNRAPVNLSVRFDGQDKTIKPGENPGFPKVAVKFAKAQNPIMGTEDPYNPTDYRCLVGVKGTKDNCKALTKEEWEDHLGRPQRVDRTDLDARIKADHPKNRVELRGRKKHSAFDARTGTQQSVDGAVYMDQG